MSDVKGTIFRGTFEGQELSEVESPFPLGVDCDCDWDWDGGG